MSDCVSGVGKLVLLRDSAADRQIPRYLNTRVIQHTLNSSAISVNAMTGLDALLYLKDRWRSLEAESPRVLTAFQGFDWCFAWASTHCNAPNVTPYIVAVYHGDRLVLIWPLMMTGIGPFRILRWLGDPYSRFGDVIARAGPRLQTYLEAAWHHIERSSDSAAIHLTGVREDAAVFSFLQQTAQTQHWSMATTCLNLAEIADKAAYDRRYSRKEQQRQEQTHIELQKLGDVAFTAHTGPGHLDSVLDQSIIAQTVRAPHISGTSVSRTDKAWTALLRTLCDQPASNLKLVTSVLRAGTRPVSYEIALRYKGRHLSCQTAYDKELAQHSPNLLHTYLSQVQALKDGLETFEILTAGDPGPKAWSDYTIGSSDFQSAFNLTGRMLSSRLAQYAKPVLQRIPGKNADAKATPAAAQHAMMARVSRVHAH